MVGVKVHGCAEVSALNAPPNKSLQPAPLRGAAEAARWTAILRSAALL